MHDCCDTLGSPAPSLSASAYHVADALTEISTSSNVVGHGAPVIVQRNVRTPLVARPVTVVVGEFGEVIVAAVPPVCVHVPVPGAAAFAAIVAVPGVEQID